MLRFVTGNLFESQAQTLVNTVNCVGIMGKGVALAFKQRYPQMYADYREKCERGKIQPGVLTLYKDEEPWVLNFPTKRHWKAKSRLEDIEAGLRTLEKNYRDWGITSLAMPALGCGQGGLEWDTVRQLIVESLAHADMDIEVFQPGSEADSSRMGEPPKEDVLFQGSLFGDAVEVDTISQKKKRVKRNRKNSSK